MFFLVLLAVALVLNGTGCSRLFGPSDAEIIKAIEDTGLLKREGFDLAAPIKVLEKGKRDENGMWLAKIQLSLNAVMLNGGTKKIVTTPTVKIFKAKDGQGNSIWKASL
jgi:hypothetical protein